ncbi:MAG: efflux RND transporter periplasmic adaptor subunit [Gammaproteobacteria bacterium]|nr:efflux RND transporter periplasmic adaptor subunit [Gammaproteobacteria bacterium]
MPLSDGGATRYIGGTVLGLLLFSSAGYAEPLPVTVKPLSELIFYPTRDAPATAVSLNDSRLSAQTNGPIDRIAVRVGDTLSKGDVLVALDCRDNQIRVEQAKHAYDAGQARNRFDRSQLATARALSKKKSISSEEVDRRISNASASSAEALKLKAELNAAQRLVEKCEIRAPFDAVVIERLASLGDYVVQGTPVMRVLDLESIEVSAKIQEQDLDSLRQAQEVEFVGGSRSFPVRLRTILPLVQSRIRSFEVRLAFTAEKATPGTAGRVRWHFSQPHIPTEMLLRREGLGIFVERDGVAEFVALSGAREGQPAEVSLAGAERIIVDGRFGLKHGDPVRVIGP